MTPGTKKVGFVGVLVGTSSVKMPSPSEPDLFQCSPGPRSTDFAKHFNSLGIQPWNKTPEQRRATSLKEILHNRKEPLATIEKYRLALALASSLLQLHSTPWLGHSLDLNDVRLISDAGPSTTIESLYISKMFDGKNSPQTPLNSNTLIKNEYVFALGVALLELSYGQSLLSLKTDADPDPSLGMTVFTAYSIASRMVEELEAREGPKYASAAKRCVLLRFETTNSTSLGDATFQQLFCKGVIEPLQQVYAFARGL